MPKNITRTTTVYSFKELIELSEQPESPITAGAVERVRSKLGEWQTNGEWYDYVYELWNEALDQIGFTDATISFSGFASQGDGASFTSDVDVEKLLWFMTHKIKGKNCIEPTKRTGDKEDFLPYVVHHLNGDYGYDVRWKKLVKHADDISVKITRDRGMYVHEKTCSVELQSFLDEKHDDLVNEWEKAIEELRYDLCKRIYKHLEEEYFALLEDEALIEFDEGNKYQWTASGKQFE